MITILLFLIVIILIYNYYVHYGRNGQLINRIPGPPGYPIFGNISQYICSREKQWKFLITLLDQYYPIFKVWAIFRPIVLIRHPDDLKTILSGTNHIEKSIFYDFLRPALGDSIFLSRGAKWHTQRKMLTPTFNYNLMQQYVKIFLEQGENMTKSLRHTESTIVEDLDSFVGEFTLNTICETTMGTNRTCLQDLRDTFQQYRKAVHRTFELFVYRLLRPWLYNNWLFSLTPNGREQKKVLRILHGFSERIIAERKLYHKRTNGRFLKSFANVTSTQADDTETNCGKKQFALLDLLIAASREGLLSDSDIRQEVDNFIFAGHDTTARALSFVLALLAEHKEIQDRVRKEVDNVIQENGGSFCIKSLKNMRYLERCIKESMRLYPSAPLISRVTCEDVKLQSYLIPAGTILLLNIYGVHRDPNFWPNPEIFEPNRFLPEKIRDQHLYSYIPFSTGPRNCIGQRYALLEMQALIAILIHNFYVEPVDTLKNLRLQADMLLTPTKPLRARFVPIYNK